MDDVTFLETLWAIPAHEPPPTEITVAGEPLTAADVLRTEQGGRPAGGGPQRLLAGIQRQGDVLVIPVRVLPAAAQAHVHDLATRAPIPVGPDRLPVVTGRHPDAHEHCLVGWGGPSWAPLTAAAEDAIDATVGVLTVPDGAIAHLVHTGHHGPLTIPPGRYVLRRQRTHAPTPIEPRVVREARSDDWRRPPRGAGGGSRWRTVWD